MPTQAIESQDWTDWLNNWSRHKIGKTVHVQAFGPGTGSHEEAAGLPFAGLIVELDHPEKASITITVGTEPGDHVAHTVHDPKQVWWKTDPPDEVLEIRSSDGTATLLRFGAHE